MCRPLVCTDDNHHDDSNDLPANPPPLRRQLNVQYDIFDHLSNLFEQGGDFIEMLGLVSAVIPDITTDSIEVYAQLYRLCLHHGINYFRHLGLTVF